MAIGRSIRLHEVVGIKAIRKHKEAGSQAMDLLLEPAFF
jgi:hypothetical protein